MISEAGAYKKQHKSKEVTKKYFEQKNTRGVLKT